MPKSSCSAVAVSVRAALVLLFLTRAFGAEVNVSAAASLKDALTEIAGLYEKTSGDKIVFNFGASNLLARQIEAGAPADVFFPADEATMDGLAKQHFIFPEARKSRLSNALAVVVSIDSSLALKSAQDLAGTAVKRLALADPKAVPAGVYAKQYLEKAGVWAAGEPKVVPTENVRAALSAVESGNVEAGIVYRTDARISKKVKVAYIVPAQDAPPISYAVAVLKAAHEPEAAKRFLTHLNSPAAGAVFEKFGFVVLP